MDLNSNFRSLVKEIPKYFLIHCIEEKLADHGIHNDEPLANALAEYILSGSKDKFQWDNDKYCDVTLSFTKEDIDEIQRRVKYFLKNELPSVAQEGVTEGAKIVTKRLTEEWPKQKIHEKNSMQGFRDRLDLPWHKGLDPLRMLLTCAREISGMFGCSLERSKAKRGIARRRVLMLLHMRACQTTMEIVTLLENGLADGALARWRTLYEMDIVAVLIYMYGDEIAKRYLDHDAVAMKRFVDNELRFHGGVSRPSISRRIQKELDSDFRAVVTEYGSDFGSSYGWAAHHLNQRNPTFQMLEKAAKNASLPPAYKWASFKVHAGVAGLIRNLGNPTEQFVALAGASNAGLDEPAISTAYTLTQITSLLYGTTTKLEKLIELSTLCILRDRVEVACTKVARTLEKEERELIDH